MKTNNYFDVVMIGKGSSSLFLSLSLDSSYRILIISKSSMNNSVYAQGGISSVCSPEDSFQKHVEDTLSTGKYLNHPETVEKTIHIAPLIIQKLIRFQMPLSYQSDQTLDLHQEGGHTQPRIIHHMDVTGKTLMNTLSHRVKQRKNICYLDDHAVIHLGLKEQVHQLDVVDLKSQQLFQISAQAVVIATGGFGAVYQHHTSMSNQIGEGAYLAVRAGLNLVNMEFVQFHPTCLHQKPPQPILTEALRGKGAQVSLSNGKRFLFDDDPRGELAPRDVTSRSIYKIMRQENIEHVWLDATGLPKQVLMNDFPQVYQQCLKNNLSISDQKIPITPAAHYSCGGIEANYAGETGVERLYAIGEASHSGLHGANRLASNSLLECLSMAYFSAKSIEKRIVPRADKGVFLTGKDVMRTICVLDEKKQACIQSIQRHLWQKVGIIRSVREMQAMLEVLERYQRNFSIDLGRGDCGYPATVLANYWLTAKSITLAALKRNYSLGCHYLEGVSQKEIRSMENSKINLQMLVEG